MRFELSSDIERWCQEALSEVDGTPASPFEKAQAAIQVHQLKVLFDISQKLTEISQGLVVPEKFAPSKFGQKGKPGLRAIR